MVYEFEEWIFIELGSAAHLNIMLHTYEPFVLDDNSTIQFKPWFLRPYPRRIASDPFPVSFTSRRQIADLCKCYCHL